VRADNDCLGDYELSAAYVVGLREPSVIRPADGAEYNRVFTVLQLALTASVAFSFRLEPVLC